MIGKDLIDSEDPKHTQFCREMAFVMICTLFRDDISIQLLEYPIPPRPARARHKNRQVPISRSAIIAECDKYIRIFEYSNILVTNIYSDIRSYQFFFYEYIRTFVGECVRV